MKLQDFTIWENCNTWLVFWRQWFVNKFHVKMCRGCWFSRINVFVRKVFCTCYESNSSLGLPRCVLSSFLDRVHAIDSTLKSSGGISVLRSALSVSTKLPHLALLLQFSTLSRITGPLCQCTAVRNERFCSAFFLIQDWRLVSESGSPWFL